MKKNNLALYFYAALMLTSILILKNNIYFTVFFVAMAVFLLIVYRFPRDKNYLKSGAIQISIITLLSYFLIIYGLGMITGFSRNALSLRFTTILGNILFPAIVIVCQEIIRYIYAKNCQMNKRPYIFLTICYIFLGIIMGLNGYNFYNLEVVFTFVSMVVVQRIALELLYSYITYEISMVPSLILNLVLSLYVYIVPIFPNLGDYLISVFGILCPAIVYFLVLRMKKNYDKSGKYIKTIRRRYLLYPTLVLLLILVFLISGFGKYKMVAIGSGSMEPIYYRGDAVIYKKTTSFSEIEEGMILAYVKNGILVTHRIVSMRVKGDKCEIITKGDNNDSNDNYVVIASEIRGIVVYKVSYIGYPTIWFNEFLGKLGKE